jgi:hypothetical protein
MKCFVVLLPNFGHKIHVINLQNAINIFLRERLRKYSCWAQWHMPVIPATQQIEIRKELRFKASEPRQKVSKTPPQPTNQV